MRADQAADFRGVRELLSSYVENGDATLKADVHRNMVRSYSHVVDIRQMVVYVRFVTCRVIHNLRAQHF